MKQKPVMFSEFSCPSDSENGKEGVKLLSEFWSSHRTWNFSLDIFHQILLLHNGCLHQMQIPQKRIPPGLVAALFPRQQTMNLFDYLLNHLLQRNLIDFLDKSWMLVLHLAYLNNCISLYYLLCLINCFALLFRIKIRLAL
jgi:hypothetical protein